MVLENRNTAPSRLLKAFLRTLAEGLAMPWFRRTGSLRAQLWLLWLFIVLISLALAAVLVGLYQRSSAAEVETGRRAAVRSCHHIQSLFAENFAAGAPPAQPDKNVLTVLVASALGDALGVEGGVWARGAGNIAYAYPTHEGSLPKTQLPADEMPFITAQAERALAGTTVEGVRRGRRDAVVVVACPLKGEPAQLAAWTMMRVRTATADAYERLAWGLGLLLGFVVLSGGWLGLTWARWSQGVSGLEAALREHPIERLPALRRTGQPDIDRIVGALNLFTERLDKARRQSEELARKLTQADRLAALGRVAAGVAHEIRNPIGAMRLKAENAIDQSTERQRAALTAIIGQIDRLDRLCESLLSASRPLRLEVREVLIPEWLEAHLQGLRERAEAGGLRITGTCEVEKAVFDPGLLGRALDNLLVNAVQHAAPAGEVGVTVVRNGDSLQVTVSDTGRGVPDGLREHIFEPFVSARGGGTGLGLAIAREIVEAHGGAIRLLPAAAGAVFEMELPWRAS